MSETKKNRYLLGFLIVFFSLTVSIGFFHTEKTIVPSPSCPACHFQGTALAVHIIDFFQQPEIRFIEVLKICSDLEFFDIPSFVISPRGPPQA